MELLNEHPQFFTASILDWIPIMKDDSHKRVITDSLEFLVKRERIILYAFVIMNDHIHLIWQMRKNHALKDVQRDFLKFTAQKMKYSLLDSQNPLLNKFRVNLKDREYQFWQRNPLSVDLYSPAVFDQKLEYIHDNPVKAGLCLLPEEYEFSSASFYFTGQTKYSFLTYAYD